MKYHFNHFIYYMRNWIGTNALFLSILPHLSLFFYLLPYISFNFILPYFISGCFLLTYFSLFLLFYFVSINIAIVTHILPRLYSWIPCEYFLTTNFSLSLYFCSFLGTCSQHLLFYLVEIISVAEIECSHKRFVFPRLFTSKYY